jgi:hypothetical protein
MIRSLGANPRRGYSMTLVVVFLILMFALWGAVYRLTSSLLRIETNRVSQQTRDQGAMNALAQAVQLLQYGPPTNLGSPYTYDVAVKVPIFPVPDPPLLPYGWEDFTVVYTYSKNLPGYPADTNRWQVQVYPGSSPKPLPLIPSSGLTSWP